MPKENVRKLISAHFSGTLVKDRRPKMQWRQGKCHLSYLSDGVGQWSCAVVFKIYAWWWQFETKFTRGLIHSSERPFMKVSGNKLQPRVHENLITVKFVCENVFFVLAVIAKKKFVVPKKSEHVQGENHEKGENPTIFPYQTQVPVSARSHPPLLFLRNYYGLLWVTNAFRKWSGWSGALAHSRIGAIWYLYKKTLFW